VSLGYRGALVLIMDGEGYAVKTAQKGILALRLLARGRACHSSTPWRGRNAIDRLIAGYLKIKEEFPAVRAGDEWHATASGNVIRAGTVFNRVPDTAEMTLDVRYTEKEKPGELLRRLRRRSGLQITQVTASPVVYCDAEHPVLLNLRGCMRNRLRRKITLGKMNGATDARHFVALGVPQAILGLPGGGAHGRNERVQLAGMARYEALLQELAMGALATADPA
ncbi:MAG: M20/M25/M40 family metallo-hydrolase, partial [Kiritimatiellia bacterium]